VPARIVSLTISVQRMLLITGIPHDFSHHRSHPSSFPLGINFKYMLCPIQPIANLTKPAI